MFDAGIGFDARLIWPTASRFYLQRTIESMHSQLTFKYFVPYTFFFKNYIWIKINLANVYVLVKFISLWDQLIIYKR